MATIRQQQTRAALERPEGNPQRNGFDPRLASRALADGLKFLRDEWKWTGSDIARILHLSPTTINNWLRKKNIPISGRVLTPEVEAVTHLLAIHRSLSSMFEEPFHQLEWLTTKHPHFGVRPKEKMTESMAGLILIRQYLDYSRGRGA